MVIANARQVEAERFDWLVQAMNAGEIPATGSAQQLRAKPIVRRWTAFNAPLPEAQRRAHASVVIRRITLEQEEIAIEAKRSDHALRCLRRG